MPKSSAKFTAAKVLLPTGKAKRNALSKDVDALYLYLAEHRYAWNARTGQWVKRGK